jgi:hypothetical protein
MTIYTTTLNGTALAAPAAMNGSAEFLGGATTLADGGLRRDLVDTSAKKRWSLSWVKLTATELGTIQTAFAAAVAGDVAFNPPDLEPLYDEDEPHAQTNAYTVNAGQTPRLTWEAYKIAGQALRYRAALELSEV